MLLACVALAAIALCMWGRNAIDERAEFYKTHFFPGTSINGRSVSGMTLTEAKSILTPYETKYELEVMFRGGAARKIKGTDINMSLEDGGKIEMLLNSQGEARSIKKPEGKAYDVTISRMYDAEALDKLVASFPESRKENMTWPASPSLLFNKDTAMFETTPAVEGNALDVAKLQVAVAEAVSRGDASLNAEDVTGLYYAADDGPSEEELRMETEELNQYCATSVTYTLADGNLSLDGSTLMGWLKKDTDGRYVKDDDTWQAGIHEFMHVLADRANTVGAAREFRDSSGETVTVSGGTYGNSVNVAAEEALLASQLEKGGKYEREPVYETWEVSKENSGLGRTYVEVDLSRQHMWYYINGELAIESDIVSGLPAAGRMTPEGVYMLWMKESPAVLEGEKDSNGKPEYRTEVSFWMAFNEGIGFHDATWQPAFGGNAWLTNGSHGCINLPYDVAKAMYAVLDYNTPIVCFYPAGVPQE